MAALCPLLSLAIGKSRRSGAIEVRGIARLYRSVPCAVGLDLAGYDFSFSGAELGCSSDCGRDNQQS